MNNDYHVLSTTESQVWIVPTEYDGERRLADDAISRVRDEHGDNEPDHIYYEGLLSAEISSAERDGIALLND